MTYWKLLILKHYYRKLILLNPYFQEQFREEKTNILYQILETASEKLYE